MRDPAERAGITGMSAVSVLGRGAHAQLAGGLGGTAGFAPVRRFDVDRRRVRIAATLPDAGSLGDELAGVVREACEQAGLTPAERAATPLLLAVHGDPGAGRGAEEGGSTPTAAGFAAELAAGTGLGGVAGVYTCACVSGSTAVADAAAQMRLGGGGGGGGGGPPGARRRRDPWGSGPVPRSPPRAARPRRRAPPGRSVRGA